MKPVAARANIAIGRMKVVMSLACTINTVMEHAWYAPTFCDTLSLSAGLERSFKPAATKHHFMIGAQKNTVLGPVYPFDDHTNASYVRRMTVFRNDHTQIKDSSNRDRTREERPEQFDQHFANLHHGRRVGN